MQRSTRGEPERGRGPRTVDARAALIMVGCCLIWGVGIVMVKIANAGISPVLNAGLRSIAAGVLVFAWARWRGIALFGRDGTLIAGLVCGTIFALEFLTLYAGIDRTTASRATVLLHSAPFVAAIGEHFFVPGHRMDRWTAAGLVAAFTGLVVTMGESVLAPGATTLTGDVLCLVGGALWGATTVVIRAGPLRAAPAEKTLLYQLAVSAALLPAASLLLAERGVTSAEPAVVAAFLYTAIAVVFIGYTTWFWLMRTYSAASLHAFTFLSPLIGVAAGALILGEPLKPGLVAGLALVAVGIYLVNKPRPAAAP